MNCRSALCLAFQLHRDAPLRCLLGLPRTASRSNRLFSQMAGAIIGSCSIVAPGAADPGATCSGATPFCTGSAYTFAASTNTTAESGPNYGCLQLQPNPAWYYLKIGKDGDLTIDISQMDVNGEPEDVDFIIWGPFSSATAPCTAQLNAINEVACSYSDSATEQFTIHDAAVGEYYLLVLTNYSGVPANITFSKTGGAGETDCDTLTCESACAPSAVHSTISHGTIPNAMQGNTANNFHVLVQYATHIEFSVFDRWGEEVYSYNAHDVNGLADPGFPDFLLQWNGDDGGGGTLPQDEYVSRLHLWNCDDDQLYIDSLLILPPVGVPVPIPEVFNNVLVDEPSFAAQPASLGILDGESAIFSVTVSGTGPFSYSWRKNGLPLANGPSAGGGTISGADGPQLTITPASSLDAGSYDVVVTNACREATSQPAQLCVSLLEITAQPQSVVADIGGSASFSVTASDPNSSVPLSYFWCTTNHGGSCFVDSGVVSGAFTDTLSISPVLPSYYGDYFVDVVSECGSRQSELGTLSGPCFVGGGGCYVTIPATDKWSLVGVCLTLLAAGLQGLRIRLRHGAATTASQDAGFVR